MLEELDLIYEFACSFRDSAKCGDVGLRADEFAKVNQHGHATSNSFKSTCAVRPFYGRLHLVNLQQARHSLKYVYT